MVLLSKKQVWLVLLWFDGKKSQLFTKNRDRILVYFSTLCYIYGREFLVFPHCEIGTWVVSRQSMHALHLAHFCWGQLSEKRKLHILYLSRKAHFVLMFFHQNIVTTAFGMLFLIKNYHRYFHKIRNNGLFAKYFPSVQILSLVINPNHELMIVYSLR